MSRIGKQGQVNEAKALLLQMMELQRQLIKRQADHDSALRAVVYAVSRHVSDRKALAADLAIAAAEMTWTSSIEREACMRPLEAIILFDAKPEGGS
jgi:hypothetical protein